MMDRKSRFRLRYDQRLAVAEVQIDNGPAPAGRYQSGN